MADSEHCTRRNLPHWYKPGFAHFVTYRLATTIPVAVLREWRARRDSLLHRGPSAGQGPRATAFREQQHKQFFAAYDKYLDTHCKRNWLVDPRLAEMIRENLYHHNGQKYQLLAWCVMPNHVHVVFQPLEHTNCDPTKSDGERLAGRLAACRYEDSMTGYEAADRLSPLASTMHSLKSYTANRANAVLQRTGPFWQAESYDHWIRDLDELERVVQYVNQNPVTAGLCETPAEWRNSSAYDRYQRDGSMSGLVGWLRDDWRGS